MQNIIPSFRDSVLSPVSEPAKELLEIGIDSVLENDVLSSIPFVNTVVALCKVGINLYERNLLKQTAEFMIGLNSGDIEPDVIEAYRQELEDNPQKAKKELGRIIIILGRQVEEVQSKILGYFYKAFVKGAISWEKFCELSEANSRMFRNDYLVLVEAAKAGGLKTEGKELYQVNRLISLGLLADNRRIQLPKWEFIDHTLNMINGSRNVNKNDVRITSFGKTFVQHMPKK